MREKLIELLDNALLSVDWEGDYYPDTDAVSDILIANGVAIPVRCKDCKRALTHPDNAEQLVCTKGVNWRTVEQNHFCSYGERKDNGT